MPDTKVMVVDDSAAMRALFCDILDNASGVVVCGTAVNADDARDQLDELKPDVLTLDVEMPGMSGMDFLAEIMENRPMPVIMLSSITQAGTGTAKRALELGAVHCFPKPLHSSREEFDETVKKLGNIVIKAANGELSEDADIAVIEETGGYEPGNRIVALACGQAGIDDAKRLLASYPANCPPTLIVFDAEPDQVERAIGSMRGSLACEIENAVDGMTLKAGRAVLAFDRSQHVVLEAGDPPRIRQVPRDPVGGFRPSADLLLGSIARAGIPAIGGVMVGTGADGAKGLQILSGANCPAFVQQPADYAPSDRYDAVKALGLKAADVAGDLVSQWIMDNTATQSA